MSARLPSHEPPRPDWSDELKTSLWHSEESYRLHCGDSVNEIDAEGAQTLALLSIAAALRALGVKS